MAQKQLRTVRANGAVLGNLLSSAERKAEYSPSLHLRQPDIDLVGLLAARSGVAAATVRAHLTAFGIGGAHA